MLRKYTQWLIVAVAFTCVGCLLITGLLTKLGILPDTVATETAEFRASQTAEQVQHAASTATAVVLALTPSDTPLPMATSTLTPTSTATFTPTITQTPNPTTGVVSVSAGDYRLDISGAWEAAEAGDAKPRRGAFLILDVALHNGSSKQVCFFDRDFRAKVDDHTLNPDNLSDVRDAFFPDRDYPGGFMGQCLNSGDTQLSLLEYDVPAGISGITIAFTPDDKSAEFALWLDRQPNDRLAFGLQSVGLGVAQVVTGTPTPNPKHTHTPRHTPTSTATFTPTITQTPDRKTGVVSVSAGDYRLDISGVWEAAEAGDAKPRRDAFLILDVALHNGSSKRACFYDRDFRAKVDDHTLNPDNLSDVRDAFFPDRDYPGGFMGQCLEGGETELSLLEYDVPAGISSITIVFTPDDESAEFALWLNRQPNNTIAFGLQSVGLGVAQVVTGTPTPIPSLTYTPSHTPTLTATALREPRADLAEHQEQPARAATASTVPEVVAVAANPQRPNAQVAIVTHVVDGDTIEVSMDGRTYRVRYIGIDTPETGEPCGSEATAANTSFVIGQTVEMVKDVSETDKYGRLLRYVYVGDLFVNAVLVDQGYAEAKEYPPDTAYSALFEQLESEARAAGLGCHPAGVFEAGDTAPQEPPSPATETWYVTGAQRVNVRTCSSTECAIITSVGYGEALTVLATTSDWHEIRLPDGRTGYLAAWLTSSAQPPVASPTLPPARPAQPSAPRATAPPVQQEQAPRAAPPPTQPPAQPAAPTWNCSGNLYNCPDFSSCGEMWSYWNACPGDPSGLDRENDGRPCEEQCGG